MQVVYSVKEKYIVQKKEKEKGFRNNLYPLIPPSGANFTIEQIYCKSMVHHEPWGYKPVYMFVAGSLQKLHVAFS